MEAIMTSSRIQSLFITHLLRNGELELQLPNGMKLEIGITQEGKYGTLEKVEDYCWVIASQQDRTVAIDSYNMGLSYPQNDNKLMFEVHCEEEKHLFIS